MTVPPIPAPPDALLQKIKLYILNNYEPVQDAAKADTRMTTNEVYQAIQNLHPCEDLSPDDVSKWLHEKGFSFFDAGKMRFEWLFKSAS